MCFDKLRKTPIGVLLPLPPKIEVQYISPAALDEALADDLVESNDLRGGHKSRGGKGNEGNNGFHDPSPIGKISGASYRKGRVGAILAPGSYHRPNPTPSPMPTLGRFWLGGSESGETRLTASAWICAAAAARARRCRCTTSFRA